MINLFSKWKDKVAQYVDVRLNLAKLAFVERTSNVLSFLIFTFILLFLGVAALIFIGIALQETFSVWVGSRVGGAFLAAAFYILFSLVIILVRKPILRTFAGMFIQLLTDQGDDDDDDDDDEARRPDRPKEKAE